MSKLGRRLIRTSAFVRKEIAEILRQPRLLVTLVLGPFLILLIFGIGYRNEPPPVRTIFVLPENSNLTAAEIEQYATTLGPSLDYQGVVHDRVQALTLLRQDKVDLVAISPENPQETIQSGEQAVFTLYHNEIDPVQVDYVNYFSEIYVQEVNRRVVQQMAQETQSEAEVIEKDLETAESQLPMIREALAAGEVEEVEARIDELDRALRNLALLASPGLGMWSNVERALAPEEQRQAETALNMLLRARQDVSAFDDALESQPYSEIDVELLDRIEQDLANLRSQLSLFTSLNSYVLIKPFTIEVESATVLQPGVVDFYAPSVIALLMQHLAVTIAALSIVREQSVGTMELFRVAPLSAGETLIGKYVSYLIFGTVIAAILTLLLLFGIDIPMLGSFLDYALVLLALIFTSLSYGFVISLISETDSQAVQYTMILLLTSVFFSGFIMQVSVLWEPVRVLSWLLPTTYGIRLLRDTMLLGRPIESLLIAGLVGIGIVLCVLAWRLLHREIEVK
ncbi:MAG: ABC transporter permease [Anaerolineales bacterium]